MGDSTVFGSISNKNQIRTDLQKEVGICEFTILTYVGGGGGGPGEWKEENAKLGEKKREFTYQSELSWGFGELRAKLNDFGVTIICEANEEENARRS